MKGVGPTRACCCYASAYATSGSCSTTTTADTNTAGAPTTPNRITIIPVSSTSSTPVASGTSFAARTITTKTLVQQNSSAPGQSTPTLSTKSIRSTVAGSLATPSVGTVPPSSASTTGKEEEY